MRNAVLHRGCCVADIIVETLHFSWFLGLVVATAGSSSEAPRKLHPERFARGGGVFERKTACKYTRAGCANAFFRSGRKICSAQRDFRRTRACRSGAGPGPSRNRQTKRAAERPGHRESVENQHGYSRNPSETIDLVKARRFRCTACVFAFVLVLCARAWATKRANPCLPKKLTITFLTPRRRRQNFNEKLTKKRTKKKVPQLSRAEATCLSVEAKIFVVGPAPNSHGPYCFHCTLSVWFCL